MRESDSADTAPYAPEITLIGTWLQKVHKPRTYIHQTEWATQSGAQQTFHWFGNERHAHTQNQYKRTQNNETST